MTKEQETKAKELTRLEQDEMDKRSACLTVPYKDWDLEYFQGSILLSNRRHEKEFMDAFLSIPLETLKHWFLNRLDGEKNAKGEVLYFFNYRLFHGISADEIEEMLQSLAKLTEVCKEMSSTPLFITYVSYKGKKVVNYKTQIDKCGFFTGIDGETYNIIQASKIK